VNAKGPLYLEGTSVKINEAYHPAANWETLLSRTEDQPKPRIHASPPKMRENCIFFPKISFI